MLEGPKRFFICIALTRQRHHCDRWCKSAHVDKSSVSTPPTIIIITSSPPARALSFHIPTNRRTDEVDRLERKVVGLEDMYGRSNPKPRPPTYDAEDMIRMKAAEESDALRLRERDAAAVAASLAWKGNGAGGSGCAASAAKAAELWAGNTPHFHTRVSESSVKRSLV